MNAGNDPGQTAIIHTEKKWGLTSFGLKMIAILTMLCDHVAAVFSSDMPSALYIAMRCIGRMAFPIFCFLLAEGFYYTKSRSRYALRLFLFCLLSEPCYDLAFHQTWRYQESQNVFWTLFLGFLMMALLETIRRRRNADNLLFRVAKGILMAAVVCAAGYAAFWMKTDYSYKGILMIAVFYFLRKHRAAAVVGMSLVNLLAFQRLANLLALLKTQSTLTGLLASLKANIRGVQFSFMIQDAGVVAAVPILFYNGQKGRSMKWFFYLFYPVHLLILYFIWRGLRG